MATSSPPTIWLQAPTPTEGVRDSMSADQYIQMLTSTNGWSQVAGQTTVVVLNLDFVLGATDAQLQQVISFLNAHNISICLMGPVLTKGADGTGLGLEGYGNPLQLQQACQRIASFGGTVQYFQMDEPLNYGYVDTDPHAEHASLSDLAQQAATSVAMVQSVFPDVQVGQVDTNAVPASAYSTFAADFQKDSGTPISFVNVDVNWSNATTPASYAALLTNLEGIAQSIRGFGAQFGVIDDGVENYTSLSWVQAAEQNMAAVEADPLLRPDISLVDSWMPQPTQLLPEGQDDTLTHVALEEIEIAPLYANGTLTGGQGVTAATIVPPIMEGVTGFGVTMPGITVTAHGGAASSTVFAVLLTDQTGLLTAQAEGAGTVSGSGTTTLRLTGTLADINAELATFRYQAVSTGTETIDVTTYDGVGYIGDNQMVVTNAAPVSATVPQSMTPTALFTAIYGTAPTEADLAPINAALAAGQTLTQAAAAWIAQAQAEATQALQQMTANLPDTATVTSWVNALVSGSSTMAQLRASETGTVQNLLIAVLSVVNPVAAGSPAKISALASQVISGAQTLEQVEAPYLIGSAQGKTITSLGQQVDGSLFNSTLDEDYTREYALGTSLTTIRAQMAALPQLSSFLTLKYFFTYGTPPTAAQLASITNQLATGTSLNTLLNQFNAAAAQQVTTVYEQMLGSAPSSSQVNTYVTDMEMAGRPIGWITTQIAASPQAEVTAQQTLQATFGFPPAPDQTGHVLSMFATGTTLTQLQSDLNTLNSLTVQVTGATPTSPELSTELSELSSGMPFDQISQNLADASTTRQLVAQQYQLAYGVAATPTQLDGYTAELASGTSFAQLTQQITRGAAADKPTIGSMAPGATMAPNGVLFPLATVVLGDPTSQQAETATVSIATGFGTLASNTGQVSADGLTVTLNGTVGSVQGALQKITFKAAAGGERGTLKVTVQNAADNTSGSNAQINVNNVNTTVSKVFLPASNGSDQLAGTSGQDVFIIPGTSTGAHVITGFDPAHDILDLPSSVVPNMTALQNDLHPSGGGSLIDLGAHGSVQLTGVNPASLNTTNVQFV